MKKRRAYLTRRGLQFRYVAFAAVVMVILSTLCTVIIYTTTWNTILRELHITAARRELDQIFMKISGSIAWEIGALTVVCACIVGYTLIFIIHRIVGPLKRLKAIAKLVEEGYIPANAQLRKKDEIHEMASHLNKIFSVIENIQTQNADRNKKIMDITEELEKMSASKYNNTMIGEYTQKVKSLLSEMKFLKRKEGRRS